VLVRELEAGLHGAPIPRLNGSRSTRAPACSAHAPVLSVEPSSITSTSSCGAFRWIAETTPPTVAASL
jgi:hypothetical protein